MTKLEERNENKLRVKSIFRNGDPNKIQEAIRDHFKRYAFSDVKEEERYKELLTPLGAM